MNNSTINYVRVVAIGLRDKSGREAIIERLIKTGVSNDSVEDAYSIIEKGLKDGVLSAVTRGYSSESYVKGESELYDAAFEHGSLAYRREWYLSWTRKLLPLVILFGLVFLLLWLARR